MTVIAPVAESVPPTDVSTVGFTVASIRPTLAATPRAPLKPRPSAFGRAVTLLATVADPMVPLVPLNDVVVLPPEVALDFTRPMPAPSPAARARPSTWASPRTRDRTVSVPALTEVPVPTAVTTTGEFVAWARAPATPAASPTEPRETRAKAGATTVGWLSPMIVL